MGHEFSHILNGDMRLNLRLIGIVYGILVLAIIGYYVMRIGRTLRRRRTSERRAALALSCSSAWRWSCWAIWACFLGNLIKSAIIRQREFLADASSVQFTRDPGGIAGALKKIGGLADGSRIRDAHAHEVSHMFFGDAFAGSFFNLFATHPPLAATHSGAWSPTFDGQFPEIKPLSETAADIGASTVAARPASFEKLGRVLGGAGALPTATPATIPTAMPPVMAIARETWSNRLAGRRRSIFSMPAGWSAGCHSRSWRRPASRLPRRR